MASAPMFASASFAAISPMPALIFASSRASRPAFASSSAVFSAVKAKVISFMAWVFLGLLWDFQCKTTPAATVEFADIAGAGQGVARA